MGYLGILEGLILGAGLMFLWKEHKSSDYEGIGYARNTPSESEGTHPIKCPPGTTVDWSHKEGKFICCTHVVSADGISYCEKSNSPRILGPGVIRPPKLLESSKRPRTESLVKNVKTVYPTIA